MMGSAASVSMPDAFFRRATQSSPLSAIAPIALPRLASSSASERANRKTTSHCAEPISRSSTTPAGSSENSAATSGGAPTSNTR